VRLLYQVLSPDVAILPDFLPERYQTAAFVSNIVLTDEAMRMGSRFAHYDGFVDEKEPYRNIYERNARRTTNAVLAWMREKRDPDRPAFVWVHYIDPHGPYHPPDDWEFSFTHDAPVPIDVAKRLPKYQREPGITDGQTYVDRYDEEIAYHDVQIGRLLDGIAELQSIEDMLIIYTADHGESMMEHHQWFTHAYDVYEEMIHIPLMVIGPDVVSGTTTKLASQIDIAPTILKFVGVDLPTNMKDVDLRTGAGIDDDRVVFSEGRGGNTFRRAAIRGDEKWVIQIDSAKEEVNAYRYYNLAEDPDELAPKNWKVTDETARLLLKLSGEDPDKGGLPQNLVRGKVQPGPKVAPGVSPENLERLKALGYVE
jgi:arylsulfatase A-like enzyme